MVNPENIEVKGKVKAPQSPEVTGGSKPLQAASESQHIESKKAIIGDEVKPAARLARQEKKPQKSEVPFNIDRLPDSVAKYLDPKHPDLRAAAKAAAVAASNGQISTELATKVIRQVQQEFEGDKPEERLEFEQLKATVELQETAEALVKESPDLAETVERHQAAVLAEDKDMLRQAQRDLVQAVPPDRAELNQALIDYQAAVIKTLEPQTASTVEQFKTALHEQKVEDINQTSAALLQQLPTSSLAYQAYQELNLQGVKEGATTTQGGSGEGRPIPIEEKLRETFNQLPQEQQEKIDAIEFGPEKTVAATHEIVDKIAAGEIDAATGYEIAAIVGAGAKPSENAQIEAVLARGATLVPEAEREVVSQRLQQKLDDAFDKSTTDVERDRISYVRNRSDYLLKHGGELPTPDAGPAATPENPIPPAPEIPGAGAPPGGEPPEGPPEAPAGTAAGPEPEKPEKKLLDINKLQSKEVKKWAEDFNESVDLMEGSKEMGSGDYKKAINDITNIEYKKKWKEKITDLSKLEQIKRDVKEVNTQLGQMVNEAEAREALRKQMKGLPEELLEPLNRNAKQFNEMSAKVFSELNQLIINEDMTATDAPAELKNYINTLRFNMMNLDREKLLNLQQRARVVPGLSEGQRQGIEDLINNRLQSLDLTGEVQKGKYVGRLDQVNITDEAQTELYEVIRNPDRFKEYLVRKLGPNPDADDRQKFFEGFNRDVILLANNLLKVADANPTAFFNELFTQYLHDPIYNNMVTGISNIVERLRQENNADMVTIRQFNYEKKDYWDQEVKLSDALDDLRQRLINEKEWKEYNHNIYNLMLSRQPLETYKNYANRVKTESIDSLLVNNPDLESAIRFHEAYIRRQYGKSGWKTPLESIYEYDAQKRVIPVDEYVRKQLRTLKNKDGQQRLKETEINRLVSMARGYGLGVSLEFLDTMASGGPKGGKGVERFRGFFGPLQAINPVRYLFHRFTPRVFGEHELLYYAPRSGGKWHERWNPKEFYAKAVALSKKRQEKEPPRVVTKKMVDKGIPFIEDEKLLGGISSYERGSWRNDMYEHIIAGLTDPTQIVTALSKVDLFVANSKLENLFANGTINRNKRNELREIVLKRMNDISPQEFINLEKDLANRYLGDLKKPNGASYTLNELEDLYEDADIVTNYLLDETIADNTPTFGALTEAQWTALFDNTDRAREVRNFMTKLRGIGDRAINGIEMEMDDGVETVIWKDAERFRSFPMHLAVKRNGRWETTGSGTVGRLFGDADTLWQGFEHTVDELKEQQAVYNGNRDKAHQERYAAYASILKKNLFAKMDSVHGKSTDALERASAAAACYKFAVLLDKYHAKSVRARLPGGAGTLNSNVDTFSSWAHFSTGSNQALEFDEQNHAVFATELLKYGVINPGYGEIEINDGQVIQKNLMDKILHRFGYKYKNWNINQFLGEVGARPWQIGFDIARDIGPIAALLFALAILRFGTQEEDKR